VKSPLPQVHTFDQPVPELVGVLERAGGDDHSVEVADDLTDADRRAIGGDVDDPGHLVLRVDARPLARPIIPDGRPAMQPIIAIGPIHIFANESGQRIQIAVVVGVV